MALGRGAGVMTAPATTRGITQQGIMTVFSFLNVACFSKYVSFLPVNAGGLYVLIISRGVGTCSKKVATIKHMHVFICLLSTLPRTSARQLLTHTQLLDRLP